MDSPEDSGLKSQSRTSITFDELKYWLESKKIFSRLFRHQTAVMRVYDLRLMAQPFASSLLLWLLAWGKSVIRDNQGKESKVRFWVVLGLGVKRFSDSLKIPGLLARIESEIAALAVGNGQKIKLDHDGRPVYLRTDLTFGVASGGSVGHIAGVLNKLDRFVHPPIFLTTDKIPTVRDCVEEHRITPGPDFWDFKEELPLAFNRKYFEDAAAFLEGKFVSFIYQRYGLNNYSGVQLAAKYRVPLVLEFNGSEVWVGRQWEKGLKHEKLSQSIEILNLQKADLVVVVSKALKEGLLRQGVPEGKILVNPNGVDPDVYSAEVPGGPVRKKYGLEGMKVIGFIGTFGKWHGAEVLADAFGRLIAKFPVFRDSVRLLMIGDGSARPLVQEALARHGVADLCVLTGAVPQSEGPTYLAACDLLVSPTVPNPDGTPFFGSPTKLFEYMAMGKGIVASDLDQIGEILKHDQTAWLVKPGDPESLMMGLKALLDDEQKRVQLGKAARVEVVAKYSWEEHTRKIIEKLKEVCA